MKFDSLMQNNMSITVLWPKSKPHKKNSNMANVCFSNPEVVISQPCVWVILTKVGLLTEFDLLKRVTSHNPKPEVKLRCCGRHLENRYNVIITPPRIVLFGWNLVYSDAERNVEIKIDRIIPIWRTFAFFQTGSSYILVDAIWFADFDLLKSVTSPNTKPEIALRRHRDCHLDNRYERS